jgi:chemosensory pili system protein ChpA (sensor histidine kinase/response regulator)
MNDVFPPFDESQLSPEDLEVLRQFDALEGVPPGLVTGESTGFEVKASIPLIPLQERDEASTAAETSLSSQASTLSDDDFLEDMLSVFAFEADEDIAILRRTLRQIEQEDSLDMARFTTLQHVAHKIKGTAGAVACISMSTIAYQIEAIARLVIAGTVNPLIGLKALVQAVLALEVTLDGLIADRMEHSDPLEELQAEYRALGINLEESGANAPGLPGEAGVLRASPGTGRSSPHWRTSRAGEETSITSPFVRIDAKRFEQLLRHTGRMAELQAPLEQAQAQVEIALKELQVAQARLRHLETVFTTIALNSKNANIRLERQALSEELPSSSLVARILREATERTGHFYQRRSKQRGQLGNGKAPVGSPLWDELEIEHYTENEVLMQQFSEAIADVATASSQLRLAFSQLHEILQVHRVQATNVRSHTLLLRLTPLNTLLLRLQRAIMMSAQAREVQFEVTGEMVEIDQDILEELKNPLLQLVRSCVTESIPTLVENDESEDSKGSKGGKEKTIYRIWLDVQALGHEIALEVGFSMPVPGGALDDLHEAIRRLNGRIFVRRNAAGGISFFLHLPRSQGTVQGLLVRAGGQQVVVPFSQVQRIDYGRMESAATGDLYYTLNDLLRFPPTAQQVRVGVMGTVEMVRPVLALHVQANQPRLLVEVEEVCGSVELVVKPLAEHLRRPGITGTAIDGAGNVLLLVNLPELVRPHRQSGGREADVMVPGNEEKRLAHVEQSRSTVLVADDSVFIRQSLLYGLSQVGYRVEEAHDGMEALEKLLELHPDVLVLDIEMPNLNGYDLLNILPAYPEIAGVKIIMLTSRSSEKHRERARELGAHAYLTKPCPQDVLLDTIKSVLGH